MLTRQQKQSPRPGKYSAQQGYILVVTVVLLSALLVMSLAFFKRTADSLQVSGYNRDSAESIVVAESAMNLLYGSFIYDADLDGDGIKDLEEIIDPSKPDELSLPYLYYTSTNGEIDQKIPSILQRIANGEARNNGGNVDNHKININTERLLINNLYSNKTHPIVFQFNNLNQLEKTNTPWSEISDSRQAAVAWLEVVKNEELAGTVQIYVQAVGKTGTSKSYVQRLIGNINTTLGAELGGMNESSL